ncbi:MAG: hypothetical protein ABFE08_00805 [Armatimonadia bacterium]
MSDCESYMLYWRNDWLEQLPEEPLNHLASNQLSPKEVHTGDVIWAVTVDQARLYLLGRLMVAELIVGQRAAEKRLGTTDLWEAKYHVIATRESRVRWQPLDITQLAPELRFKSNKSPRLTIVEGEVVWHQLQAMRTLTLETSRRLELAWAARPRAQGK